MDNGQITSKGYIVSTKAPTYLVATVIVEFM